MKNLILLILLTSPLFIGMAYHAKATDEFVERKLMQAQKLGCIDERGIIPSKDCLRKLGLK